MRNASVIGDELAIRAALDPAWDAVLAVYLDGLSRWPTPWQNRRPEAQRPAIRSVVPSTNGRPPSPIPAQGPVSGGAKAGATRAS